jgi:hypothetical protein
MGWTRREALAGAGAAWLALAARPAPAMVRRPPLRESMGLGFDLTPQAVRAPGSLDDYRVLRGQPWGAALIARATHVRFWVDWPIVQPDPRHSLADPANPGQPNLVALDGQVDAAVADGLEVILLPYRYPFWVNGERRHFHTRSPEWRMPDSGHGPYSPWAEFVEALWARYAGRMAYFEVVNEPNLQIWPQAGVAKRVAWMVATVDAVARRHGFAATCLAPSVADAESRDVPELITPGPRFTAALLDALDRRGFAGGDHWIWSFHNYNDAEQGGDRVGALRAQLRGRWRGRRADDGGPLVYATEGGVRLSAVSGRAEQARMLAGVIARYERAPGIGLFTQYTVCADPGYDCGLRDSDGARRPAFDAFVTSM